MGTGLTDTPKLYVGGTLVDATYNSSTGTLTPTTALTDGSKSLTYTLTDAAGNDGTATTQAYTLASDERLAEASTSALAIVVVGPTMIAGLAPPRHQGLAMTLWSSFFGVTYAVMALLGRPRIDVTLRVSGLFRDIFPGLAQLFETGAAALAARPET